MQVQVSQKSLPSWRLISLLSLISSLSGILLSFFLFHFSSVFFAEQMHSVNISKDSRYALINQRPNETQLWDIASRTALARYVGHKVEQDVIGNCFGGATETFVVTGSEGE